MLNYFKFSAIEDVKINVMTLIRFNVLTKALDAHDWLRSRANVVHPSIWYRQGKCLIKYARGANEPSVNTKCGWWRAATPRKGRVPDTTLNAFSRNRCYGIQMLHQTDAFWGMKITKICSLTYLNIFRHSLLDCNWWLKAFLFGDWVRHAEG